MSQSRIRLLIAIPFFLLIAGFTSIQAKANTLYVSPNGNDSNPGTISSPLATPAQALSNASAGDTIYLRQGTYNFTRGITIDKDGITLAAYQNETPFLVGAITDTTNMLNMIYITGNNVTLVGLDVQGGSYYGIKLESNSGTIIQSCKVHDTGRDSCKMYLADHVQFLNCDFGHTGERDTTDCQCINAVACNYALIKNCYFHDSVQNGCYLKGGSVGGVIENNLIQNCGYGGILLGQDTDLDFMRDGTQWEAINCMAVNNVIINCGGPGLGTYSGNNIRFENNTCWNVAQTYNAGLYIAANSRNVQGQQITFLNNIVAVNGARPAFFSILLSDQLNSDYNFYYELNGGNYGFWMETPSTGNYWNNISDWRSGMNCDQHSQTGDPHLDSSNLYKPLAGSLAIDAGTTVSEVPNDYAGTSRPQGKAYDIGAFEIIQAGAPIQPPTVSISASATSGPAPLTVNFVSTASSPNGQITSYAWNFGDGATSTAASPSHLYNNSGSFNATLTVTDNTGAKASASKSITISGAVNQPPTVSIAPSTTTGAAPLTVNFVSTASDPDGQISSYSWNFGDGGASTAASPAHVYNNAGSFTATLTVTDNKGAKSSASVTINVTSPATNLPPTVSVSANPTSGTSPLTVQLTANASDPDGSIVSYNWNLGDGQTSTASSLSHVYSQAGTFHATVTVTDNGGATATASVTITVSAAPNGSGSGVSSAQNVTWVNGTGVSISGNSVTKTAVSTWGNAGATSTQSMTTNGGYFEFTAMETNNERMAGLSAKTSNKAISDLSFAVHLNTGAAYYITEFGKDLGYFGDYRQGDVFRVTVNKGTVTYSRNGQVFYTSKQKATVQMYAAAVLDGQNSTIQHGMFVNAASSKSVAVNVLSPTAASTVKSGQTYTIGWSITNAQGASLSPSDVAGSSVDVQLSIDNGDTWNTIGVNIDPASGSYNWSITPGLKAKKSLIKIVLVGTDGSESDGTSGTFKIKPTN